MLVKSNQSMNKKIYYATNKCGIKIAMICASCHYCQSGEPYSKNEDTRACKVDPATKGVKYNDTCNRWQAQQRYMNIGGFIPGRIKTKEFIDFVTGFRIAENTVPKGQKAPAMKDLASVEHVRQLYAQQYPGKSIYMDI